MKNCEVPGFIGDACRTQKECFLEIEVENHKSQGIDLSFIDSTIEACRKCPNYTRIRGEIDRAKS